MCETVINYQSPNISRIAQTTTLEDMFTRSCSNKIPAFVSNRLSCTARSSLLYTHSRCYSNKITDFANIKTLEDLAKLKNIDDVPPELVRQLILKKTNEVNTENEIQMLKELTKEEEYQRSSSFNEIKQKYSRPFWNLFLLSSSVYLAYHWLWLQLDYDETEKDLKDTVQEKELELIQILEANKTPKTHVNNEDATEPTKTKTQKKFWLF